MSLIRGFFSSNWGNTTMSTHDPNSPGQARTGSDRVPGQENMSWAYLTLLFFKKLNDLWQSASILKKSLSICILILVVLSYIFVPIIHKIDPNKFVTEVVKNKSDPKILDKSSKYIEWKISKGNSSFLLWSQDGNLTDKKIGEYIKNPNICVTKKFAVCYLSGSPTNVLFYGPGGEFRLRRGQCADLLGKCYVVGGARNSSGSSGIVVELP